MKFGNGKILNPKMEMSENQKKKDQLDSTIVSLPNPLPDLSFQLNIEE